MCCMGYDYGYVVISHVSLIVGWVIHSVWTCWRLRVASMRWIIFGLVVGAWRDYR